MQIRRTSQIKTAEAVRHSGPATSVAAPSAPVHPILRLQQTIGNQAVQRLLQSHAVQAKPAISQPGDVYEQEADRVAEQVMRMPVPTVQRACAPCAAGGAPCPKCENEKEGALQRKPEQAADAVDASVPNNFLQSVGPSQPLDPSTRAFFEPRFGHDFRHVQVHTDTRAAESARAVNALAFTVGRDVVFGAGQYAPGTGAGRQLIAHELTHVVQQSVAGGIRGLSPIVVAKSSDKRIMRKGFESTVKVCHGVLESRHFEVTKGGLRVVLVLNNLDKNIPNCQDFDFGVTLTRSEDWWPDDDIGTCAASTGGTRSFSFANLSAGTYYLTIWQNFGHPYCCLEGEILVFDEAVSNDSTGCTRDKDPSVMDIVHGALDIAGFIPVLGAIPDGVNAAIYVVEGDWANAGLSAVAMVPAWGDGVKLGVMAGKTTIKISEKAAIRLGEEGIARGLKEVKAASKVEKAALETTEEAAKLAKAEKEAAEQVAKAEKEAAENAAKAEREAAEKKGKERKKDEKEGKKGKWGCRDVRCNVYQNRQAKPLNENCPERVIGEVPYIYPNFNAACTAAQVAANLLVPRGCIKRHCNCETKCTKK